MFRHQATCTFMDPPNSYIGSGNFYLAVKEVAPDSLVHRSIHFV